jgi:hypothetical protein
MGVSVRSRIRALLEALDLEDPHEFCTAYVDHVEVATATQSRAIDVSIAAHQWVRDGYLSRPDLVFYHR